MTKKAGKRRQEYLERKEFRYYIFCEGEQTEPQYFSSFKKYIESNPIYKNLVLIEIEPCGAETMRVISQAEEFVRKNKVKYSVAIRESKTCHTICQKNHRRKQR